ncbi:LacI family transcriptional regulator [Hoeflea sp. WL0058]|uniref:LacI family transcriptional regulator n=1 Tax=Flavimaribacter sediminis TaxID=2865987 RepID=A0AAE2ZQ50_9HYPH|nr:LacI family DNA-binding transcriptional regulator [Flavimaribacter sediminis]MBW8637562.1 LacI family transcriptional regulator [Flavimaribacter sediminis]
MRRPSMKELAQRLGVDRSTISRALSQDKAHLVAPETREKVRRMAIDAGYRPDLTAASLRRGRSQTIGVLVADLENETFINVIRTLIASLNVDGVPVTTPLIAETRDKPNAASRLIETFLSRRVDAIISLASTEADERALEDASREVPVILAIRTLAALNLPSALCDDREGGAMVARHLVERGHKLVCQVQGPPLATTFKLRAQGFSKICADLGVREVTKPIYTAEATPTAGKKALDLVFDCEERPTAIFAHNDAIAIGVIEALRERGLRVPEDMAVAGFNDTRLAQVLSTPLTTVAYPIREVGEHAALLFHSLIAGEKDEAGSRTFMPELIVRRSA